ncbi:AraC family transcriptional regulator [Galbibacter sp. BG1]|uniref:AraC family transcriptional regulator n=1 Tax=Galbibacter sp. BG1 TaxID=1170699 RepID=UPI0015BDDDF2|nr:AraC family transcriptional regulator [Galbibacter sp. BG1]QLE01836.1 AraC family transcriptional regulator [Galbibacter sp. BG1]
MNGDIFHEGFLLTEETIEQKKSFEHGHNYFQIIYMKEGEGNITINGVDVAYKKKSIFLMAPEDIYALHPLMETSYTSIKFTEILFSNKSKLPDRHYWLQQIEHILHHPNLMPSDCISIEEDRDRLWRIHDFIVEEYKAKNEFYWSIISNGVTTTISIIARNIIKRYTPNKEIDPSVNLKRTDQILSYIRTNVYDPELMKIENLANQFNMSQANIVNLFKKETGESIRQYIINYKLMLTKYRLRNTNYTISEIGYELGFTDESHLTKAFKKHFGKTPKQYRLESIKN